MNMKKIFVVLIFCLFCFCSCNNNKYDFVNESFTIEYCHKINSDFTICDGLITVKYDGNNFITYHYNVYPKHINNEIEHEYDTVYVFSDTLKDVRITRDVDHIIAYKQTEDGDYIVFENAYFEKK